MAYHLWERDHRPQFRTQTPHPDAPRLASLARRRVHALLGSEHPPPPPGVKSLEPPRGAESVLPGRDAPLGPPPVGSAHGLGAVRTLGAFAARVGVDFGARRVLPGAEHGGVPPDWFSDNGRGGAAAASAGLMALALQMQKAGVA